MLQEVVQDRCIASRPMTGGEERCTDRCEVLWEENGLRLVMRKASVQQWLLATRPMFVIPAVHTTHYLAQMIISDADYKERRILPLIFFAEISSMHLGRQRSVRLRSRSII